jgi:CRISPR/Cas system-associated protein Csm6
VVGGSAEALYTLVVPGAVLGRGALYKAHDANGDVVWVPVPVQAVPSLRVPLLPVLVAFLRGCADDVVDDVFPGLPPHI